MLNHYEKFAAHSSANGVFLILMLIVLAVPLVFTGCNYENKDWDLVKTNKTLEAYEEFSKKYPNSQFAQKAIDEVWRLTEEKHTIQGYESFLASHPNVPSSTKAKANIKTLWAAVTPKIPTCGIDTNLTVDLSWPAQSGAQSYIVYWSQQKNFTKNKKDSVTSGQLSMNHKLRVGEYGAKLPMFYKIAAVKDGIESKLSDACYAHLLPDKGGKFCQLCGAKAVGHCHLRDIYVCAQHSTFTSDTGTNWQCP